jgi:hypothetical protein
MTLLLALVGCGAGPDDCIPPPDADGDGFPALAVCGATGPADCNDADPAIRPDAPELCDGVDTDCDGLVDEDAGEGSWFLDADGDGYGAQPGTGCRPVTGASSLSGDCDDANPDVSPAAREACNGIDDDCDGVVEDRAVPGDHATIQEAVDAAAPGDDICVAEGTFAGGIRLDKAVTLRGQGAGLTVVEGGAPSFSVTADATLQELTVRGGIGGSFDVTAAAPTVRDVTVEAPVCGEEAPCSGLVLRSDESSPAFVGVEVRGVSQMGLAADLDGGLFYLLGGAPSFEDLTVAGNSLRTDAALGFDVEGGLLRALASPFTCTRCRFVDNEVVGEEIFGGLLSLAAGSDAVFQAFVVAGNDVGALGPRAEVQGGLLRVGADETVPTISYADVTGNKVSAPTLKGGVFYVANAGPVSSRCGLDLRSVAVVDNDIDGGEGRVLAVETNQSHGVTAFWIDVFGNQVNDLYTNWPGPDPADGNLTVEPVFVDVTDPLAELWDLHLQPTSGLVDAGDPSQIDVDGSASDIGSMGGPEATWR